MKTKLDVKVLGVFCFYIFGGFRNVITPSSIVYFFDKDMRPDGFFSCSEFFLTKGASAPVLYLL